MIVKSETICDGKLKTVYLKDLADMEKEILRLEQLLEVGPEMENANLAALEFYRKRANQIRDTKSIEKMKKPNWVKKEECHKKHFTPRDFGAVEDGVTDDTVAVQNYLDYMSKVKKMENWFPKKSPSIRPGFCENISAVSQMAGHPMGRVLIKAFELCLRKNADYATQEDIFANFREAQDMGTPPSKGVANRLSDKWVRFKKGVRTGWKMSVKSEGMEDTIVDIINYACIYHCLYLEELRDKVTESHQEPDQGPRSPGGL